MAVDTLYSLVTVSELKDFIAGETGDYSDAGSTLVAPLEVTIDAVSRWMHEYTGRQLKQAQVTEYHDGDGTTKLYVNSPPVAAGSAEFFVDFVASAGCNIADAR